MLRKSGWVLLFIAILMLGIPSLSAQEIILDKMVPAGPLTCFQSFDDPKVYYYLPDHPRLAVHENGKPQFSFLKYVRNVDGKGEGGITDAEGGGIVHFLVEYGATKAEVREAERALQQKVPEAKIEGPILYRSGHFTLVSSFKEKDGEFTKRIVGIGRAPLIEGHKAAISINLTRTGAQVLWESFQTATPDISVLFEMEYAGYREPYDATLTADWSMIAKHKSFAAGAKFLWFGAQIQSAFDELRQSGAIQLTTKGENKDMDKLVATAYSKLQDIIFEKAPRTMAATAKADNDFSIIKDVIKLYNSTRSRRRRSLLGPLPEERDLLLAGEIPFTDGGPLLYAGATSSSGLRSPGGRSNSSRRGASARPSRRGRVSKTHGTGSPTPKGQPGAKKTVSKPSSSFGFSMIASYRMKQIKKSGTFKMDFNQFLEAKQPVAMAENIGDLFSKYGDDPKIFRAVNIDDPVFKQREVLVSLDGQNSSDFEKYVNFVTVQLRKVHESGDETIDEVVIRRDNFNREGNSFRMLYGWKGDNDREQWLHYEYRTDWSFHGGMDWQGKWTENDQPMISASPPYAYRRLTLEAEPEVFRERGVRHATIKIYYPLLGKEMTKQATIKTSRKRFSLPLDYIHSRGDLDYEYEIAWRLKGGKSVSSGRKKGDSDVLYCDEIP